MEKLKSHKIFYAISVIGVLVLSILSYLSKNALISDENAAENLKIFNQYYGYLSKGNLILFAILLFVSNILFINKNLIFPFILTAIIFMAFNIVDWFWLSEVYFHYKKKNQLWQGETNLSYIVGFLFTFLGLVLIILNLGILKVVINRKAKNKNKLEIK